MSESSARVWKWLPAAGWTLILAATQVSPTEATDRLKAWAKLVGVALPQGLTATRLLLILGVAVVLYYGFVFRNSLRPLLGRLTSAYRAFRQPPPSPQKPPPPPPTVRPPPEQLSDWEKHTINLARGFWRQVGNDASGDVEWLLRGVVEELSPTVRLVLFLGDHRSQLATIREGLDDALVDGTQTPLTLVAKSLVMLFNLYMDSVRWLHECSDTHGVNLEAEPHAARYRHWQQVHPAFVAKIKELSDYEGYAPLRYPVQHEGATEIRFKKMEA